MLRIKKSQMIVVEGEDGFDFQKKYNTAMDELTRVGVTVDDKQISIERMSAVILYHEDVRIPQCLQDELALKGIFPTCDLCPHYCDLGKGNGACTKMDIHGQLRHDDLICKKRWLEMEQERRYVDVSRTKADTQGQRDIENRAG